MLSRHRRESCRGEKRNEPRSCWEQYTFVSVALLGTQPFLRISTQAHKGVNLVLCAMLSADSEPVVVDLGSYTTKAGFASERQPRKTIRTLAHKDVSSPIQSDIVSDWDGVKEILDHTIQDDLAISSSEHAILITGLPFLFRANNSKTNKENMTQILFEDLCVQGAYFQDPSALAVVSTGRSSGCVVSLGHHHTYIAPIYEGQPFRWDPILLPVASETITNNIVQRMHDHGYRVDPIAQRECARQIIRTQAYVAHEPNLTAETVNRSDECILPDGSSIRLGQARSHWAEVLFQPCLVGEQHFTIAEEAARAIYQSDPTIRRDLCSNVTLVGGTSLLPGFAERMTRELTSAAAADTRLERLRVNAHLDRQYASWLGGAVVATSSSFGALMISRAEYDECGPSIAHSKCY